MFAVYILKTPLPEQTLSRWCHVFTLAIVHATDIDVTFYDGPGMLS